MTFQFTIETIVKAAPELVFDLSRDMDVHVHTMPSGSEQAIAGVTSGLIGQDQTVTWRARHLGVTWTMTSQVRELKRPTRFIDQQVSGPFKSFHHVHEFIPGPAGVTMRDTVTLRAPGGRILGWLIERAGLGWYLARLIRLRGHGIKQLAEQDRTDAWAP